MNQNLSSRLICLVSFLGACQTQAAPVYSQDANLSSFTSTVQTYAQVTNYWYRDNAILGNTPTTADVEAGYRIGGRAVDPIKVDFGIAVSQILVFPNIDHIGFGFDAYQYTIYGSTDGLNYSLLFAPLTVNEVDAPGTNFTLKTWTGIAPTLVNNVLTPGAGPGGIVGYEAYFDFGASSYRYYMLGVSSVPGGYDELEISAVAQAHAVPEPATWSIILVSFGFLFLQLLRRRANFPK